MHPIPCHPPGTCAGTPALGKKCRRALSARARPLDDFDLMTDRAKLFFPGTCVQKESPEPYCARHRWRWKLLSIPHLRVDTTPPRGVHSGLHATSVTLRNCLG